MSVIARCGRCLRDLGLLAPPPQRLICDAELGREPADRPTARWRPRAASRASPSACPRLAKFQKAAKDAGYEVRIALIATRYDLGAVPSLFGKPQTYAKFLQLPYLFRA